jgi:hypothetical protein
MCLRVIISPPGGAFSTELSKLRRRSFDSSVEKAPPTIKINVR